MVFAFAPSILSAKPAPGSVPPLKDHLFFLGGDITPKIYKDTIDDHFLKVAVIIATWQYEMKRYLHGTGTSYGFEGEWGENHRWLELRFFMACSIGLYYFGYGISNPWSWTYANIGGASIGPILEFSTKSWESQGIGAKADIWHMIGPIGAQFDIRLLTSKGFIYAGGLMVRLPIPVFY
jgi:hypothetical protein